MPESDSLRVLRGSLLQAAELSAPFDDPGPAVGRFVLRSSRRGDLRVDPGVARLKLRHGALRARAVEPSEDPGGLLELCRLGLSPFACAALLPFRPPPGFEEPGGIYLPPLVELGLDAVLTPEEQALLGCGAFYGTVCDGTLPSVDRLLRAGGNGSFGRRDFIWVGDSRGVDPFTGRLRSPVWFYPGDAFRSELAVLSWNAILALVGPTLPPQEFHPEHPFRIGGCSFANPAACGNVSPIDFVLDSGWRFSELAGDPRGGDRERWLWESAVAYEVEHARGDLAGFRDGRLYVYGPFESSIPGSESVTGFLLVPPEGVVPETTSPLVHAVPGPDGSLGTEDDGVAGIAWGTSGSGFDGFSGRRPERRGRAFGHGRGDRKHGPRRSD